MHRHLSRLLSSAAALLACALVLIPSLPAAAQEAPAPSVPTPTISVLVELMGEPAAALYARAGDGAAAADAQAVAAATQAQVAAVAAEQQAMQATLASLGAQPLYSTQRVYNGIAVRVAADQLDALRALPGVRAVTPLVAKQPDNARTAPFLGVPALWAGVEGVAARGENITIAIIDTGIDYSHTDFGGLGSRAPANDPTDGNDHPDFPSAKVIGGYDFVGDSYNANPLHPGYQPEPQPDADPLDCFGHGTHVSGTAAGYGVTGSGAQYSGPWDSSTDFASPAIGPGVAPLAQIYALKVFGCAGSSEVVDLALEWATDPNQDGDFSDHVDVINLSLGSAFGSTEDTTSRAAAAAAEVGVIVVASAGNNGDVAYAVGSPGVAESVLSVAATQIDPAPSGVAGSLTDLPASFSSRGPADDGHLKPDLAAPGVSIVSARNGSGSGSLTLSGTSMAAPQVAGAMALLRQLRPGWRAAELKALVMNTAATLIRAEAAYTSTLLQPARVGSGRIDVGSALRSPAIAFDAAHPERVSLSFGVVEVAGSRVEQSTVSVVNRGGEAITYRPLYQPLGDIAGVDFTLPGPLTMTVGAGGAHSLPLLLEADAAAIRNARDATMGSFPDLPHAWQNEESGLLWLWPEPALFTATVAGATLAAEFDLPTRTLRTRVDASAASAAEVTTIALHRGLPGFADAAPAYTLYTRGSGPAPALPLTGTVAIAESDLPLLASGALQLVVSTGDATRGSALVATTPPLKLAVHAAVRAASEMRAAIPALEMGATGAATRPLPLAGVPLTATVTPTGTQSLVSLLELHARSPRGSASLSPPIPGEIDFQFVGIGSDVGAVGSLAEARVFFGLSVYEPWSSPGTVRFSFFVDSTGDDVPDYRVFTTNQLALDGGTQASDLFVAGVETLATSAVAEADPLNALSPNEAYTAIFNSRVMVISVPARLLGIERGRTRLRIRPQSARVGGESDWTGDRTGVLVYDLARPGLELSNGQAGSPLFPDQPGGDLEVGFDLYGYSRSTARGLLLLHHHNAGAQQAEAVNIRFQWPHVRLLPLIENGAPPN